MDRPVSRIGLVPQGGDPSWAQDMRSLAPASSSPLSVASPRSPLGMSPRSSRFGSASTSPANLASVKVEGLLKRMESRMEAVEQKAGTAEKSSREVTRLQALVKSQQKTIDGFERQFSELNHELGGMATKVADRVERSLGISGLERRLLSQVELQDEKMSRLQEKFESGVHAESKARSEALAAVATEWKSTLEAASAKIEPVAAEQARQAVESSRGELDRVRISLSDELAELAVEAAKTQKKISAKMAEFEELFAQSNKSLRSMHADAVRSAELARAADRDRSAQDMKDVREKFAALADKMMSINTDQAEAAVQQLERKFLAAGEEALAWQAQWMQTAEHNRRLQMEATAEVGDKAELGRVELRREQQRLLDASVEEARAAQTRLETTVQTQHTDLMQTMATLESKLGPAIALTREAMRAEIEQLEQRSKMELAADSARVEAEARRLCADLESAIEALRARTEQDGERLHNLLKGDVPKKLEEVAEKAENRIKIVEETTIAVIQERLESVIKQANDTASHIEAKIESKLDTTSDTAIAARNGLDTLRTRVTLTVQDLEENVKHSVLQLEESVNEMGEKWSKLEEEVAEVAMSCDLNTILQESSAMAEVAETTKLCNSVQANMEQHAITTKAEFDEHTASMKSDMDVLKMRVALESQVLPVLTALELNHDHEFDSHKS
eukprot:COSAG05_NODE_45_length_25418_cov_92.923299_20_plen_677_part_00